MDADPEGDGTGFYIGISGKHGDDQGSPGGKCESIHGDQGCSGADFQVGY